MICKISSLEKFAKFTGKHLLWSLVFHKVTGCKNLQNSQGNTRVRVLFLIKLHAGGTISTSSGWYTCIFYCTAFNKMQAFFTIYAVCFFLLITEKFSIHCLHSVNIVCKYLMPGTVTMFQEKYPKLNETKIFVQSCQVDGFLSLV